MLGKQNNTPMTQATLENPAEMQTELKPSEVQPPEVQVEESPTTTFADLDLSPEVLKALEKMDYKAPSPIQAATIPTIKTNVDIIGQAQTGTGKTAAFAIPMIEKIDVENKDIQAVVICPTRELALQVADNCKKMSQFKQGLSVVSVYGGQDFMIQKAALRRRPQILIATPGRLLDFILRGVLTLHSVKTVVLDEADEMLNMGFLEDIDMILGCMNAEDRQTIFFSATMPKPILELTKKYQKNPQIIKVAPSQVETTQILQTYVSVRGKQKPMALTKLIMQKNITLGLVFCNTKRQVDFLSENLRQEGIKAEGLHGGKAQNQRERILGRFRKGITQILIATDVAARGIDVKNVQAVINFDLPEDTDNYTHRIGRTGRAGKTGEAISLVASNQVGQFYDLQRSQKNKIMPMTIDGVDSGDDLSQMNMPHKSGGSGGGSRFNRNGRRRSSGSSGGGVSRQRRTEGSSGSSFGANKPRKSSSDKPYAAKAEGGEYKKSYSSNRSADKKPYGPKAESGEYKKKPYKAKVEGGAYKGKGQSASESGDNKKKAFPKTFGARKKSAGPNGSGPRPNGPFNKGKKAVSAKSAKVVKG